MKLSYVLITTARNEEAFIHLTIQSVIAQTILPKKWIIISDGSTDRTDEIVQHYAKGRNWIEFIRMPDRKERHYAGKAYAFNAGYERVKNLEFNIVGNLDADISFEKDYFDFLLSKFSQIPELGVTGSRYVENNEVAIYSFKDVAGQCQLFRRKCFEEIGGYFPSKYGGIDNIAVITARMKGWKTLTFNEKTFIHHRPMSTAGRNRWTAKIKHGREDFILGNHPLWEFFRIIYQVMRKPYFIGGIFLSYGYITAFLTNKERQMSQDLINFYRKQQIQRLKLIFKNILKFEIKIEET